MTLSSVVIVLFAFVSRLRQSCLRLARASDNFGRLASDGGHKAAETHAVE